MSLATIRKTIFGFIWQVAEASGISLGRFAPFVFGEMIGCKAVKIDQEKIGGDVLTENIAGHMRRSCVVQIQCETPRPGFVLGFSIDHDTYAPEEGCESPGHFPVAVVEYEDGRLSSVPVRFVRMTDQIESK